ncbi:MAG: DUF5011 domain-containing protein, partial [Coriobacteriia bacterium]|nr:DUF5011 domain-containing protein [Coriobacteriia bacterium]
MSSAKRTAGTHARAVGQPARRSKEVGLLRKALAILLALNMAIMLMVPAGAIADQIVAPPSDDLVAATDSTQDEQNPDGTDGGEEEATNDDVEYADEAEEVADDAIEPDDTFEAFDEPEADDPDEAIAPLGITTLGPGRVSVDTWVSLCDAMRDSSINYIEFSQDIQRTAGDTVASGDLPDLNRSLTINGNGKTLDFRAGGATTLINRRGINLLNAAPAGSIFTLQNVNIIRSNSHGTTAATRFQLIVANNVYQNEVSTARTDGQNWTVVLENLTAPTSGATAPSSGLLNLPSGVAKVKGTLTWDTTTGPNPSQWILSAYEQYYEGSDTNVLLRGTDTIANANINGKSNKVEITGGAQVKLESITVGTPSAGGVNTKQPAIRMATAEENARAVANTQALLVVDGAGTKLEAYSDGSSENADGGTVVLSTSAANRGGGGGFRITGGAEVDIVSTRRAGAGTTTAATVGQPAIVQQVEGGTFIVSGEGTQMNVESWGVYNNDRQGVIRFRMVGDQYLTVTDGASLKITRHAHGGSATVRGPGIRFGPGDNNGFIVSKGGFVEVLNEGNTNAQPATVANMNTDAAIEFYGSNWSFEVTDPGSAIVLESKNGSVIAAGDTNVRNGSVTVGDGAVFIARGNVNSNAIGVIHGNPPFTFTANHPLFYDLANTHPRDGARWISLSNGTTTQDRGNVFTSTNSDVAVWGNNSNGRPNNPIAGDPYKDWSMISYELYGRNFVTLGNSNDPTFSTDADSFGANGMQSYRRISGNNGTPQFDEIMQPTNADKYVRVIGRVPEGLPGSGRPLWTDEIKAHFDITHEGSTTKSALTDTRSLRDETIYSVETNVDDLEGVLRYTKPNDEFLITGDVYKLADAWRGKSDTPSGQAHLATADDLPANSATVMDILPPAIAVITDPTPDAGKNGRIWKGITEQIKGTWLDADAQKAAAPHNPEPAVVGYAILVSGTTQTELGEINLNSDGTWDYTIPEDKLSTLNEGDKIYIVLEDENENRNPLADTPCHDTMVEAAPYMEVSDPDVKLFHTDAFIGTLQAAEIADLGQDSPAQWEELLKVLNAYGEKKNNTVTMDPAIKVLSVEPVWDVAAYYNLPEFKALNPKGKVYAVTYGVVADPSISRIGYITVVPFEQGDAFIGANDFTITIANATEVMSLSTADRDAKLIELAGAEGRYSIDDDYSPNNVKVTDVKIPSPAQEGDWDVTFSLIDRTKLSAQDQADGKGIVTIQAHVIPGNMPIIDLKNPIEIWIGDDPNDPKRMKTDSFLPGEFTAMYGVTAWSELAGADITDKVTYTGTWDETKVDFYPVIYSVTNDDGNSVSATRVVIVNDGSIIIDDFGAIKATGFVKKQGESDPATILTDAKAEAWIWDESAPSGKVPGTAEVVPTSIGSYAMNCPVGDYPLQIQIKEDTRPANERLISDIVATVITKDVIETDTDPDTNKRYSVGANHVNLLVSEAAAYANSGSPANSSDAVKLMLINKSEAEAWYLTDVANKLNTAPFDLTSLDQAGVVVLENNIPANPTNGSTYTVTFGVKESPGITATVNYLVSGTPPMIVFEEAPLIIDFVPGSTQNLTAAEIKDK